MPIPEKYRQTEISLRRIVIAAGILVLLACVARAIIKTDDGDFKVHWETGRRFLAGEFLYTSGHDFPYPPFFGMVLAPAALLPMPVAKIIICPLGILALITLLRILSRLVRPVFVLDDTLTFWTAALAVFLALQFLIRDQAELGLNTAITLCVWASVDLWRSRHDLAAGILLGFAIAIKCTPAVFLGYFIWKRQWRSAIFSIFAALLFTLAPMIWQGPASWNNHMQAWIVNSTHGISGSGGGVGENELFFRPTNFSLRSALSRYIGSWPNAYFIESAVSLGLVAIFLWWSRRSIVSRDEPRVFWELAAVAILMLLISPITWSQHCVALLPACFLVAGLVISRDRIPAWITAILFVYVVFCVLLGRDLIGRNLSAAFADLHLTTMCFLGLFAIALAGPGLMLPDGESPKPSLPTRT